MCATSASSNGFLQRLLVERIEFRSSWKQQGHPTNPTKTKDPIIKNGETGEQPFTKEIEKDVLFCREGTKDSTRTVRPVYGPKSIQSCVSMPVELVDKNEDKDEDVDADQTRTGKPSSRK